DRLDGLHQLQVLLEIARTEARLLAPDIVRGDVVDLLDVSGEEAAAERRVRDKADAELAACGQDLVLDVARPQRIFGLQRGDRVDPASLSENVRRSYRVSRVTQTLRLLRLGLFRRFSHVPLARCDPERAVPHALRRPRGLRE